MLSGSDSAQLTALRTHGAVLADPISKGSFTAKAIATKLGMLDKNLFDHLIRIEPEIRLQWGSGLLGYVDALNHMLLKRPYRILSMSARGWGPPELERLVASGRMPVPVWEATARPITAPACVGFDPRQEISERSRPLEYAAFEISPVRTGSDELGFLSHMWFGLAEATAISGAGMSLPYNDRCKLLRTVDASVTLENFPARVDPTQLKDMPRTSTWNNWPAPADPTQLKEILPRSSTNESFELTDGGIADNLAVFPLIRRLCADIVVVDAEFDPYLIFPGYGYLKQQLAQMDIRMEVPGVEAVAQKNRLPTDSSAKETPCERGSCLISPRPECIHRDASAGCIPSDHLPVAVYEGEIGPIPYATVSRSGLDEVQWRYSDRLLRLHYIKLSLDAAQIDAYPRTVKSRYASHAARRQHANAPCVTTRNNGACSYPHEPSADLDYRQGKFGAYWDLGRCIVERYWPDPATGEPSRTCGESNWRD
jgi:hypothetical protein